MTELERKIEDARFRMLMAKRDGHMKAYRDSKKCYDRLMERRKKDADILEREGERLFIRAIRGQ